MFFTLIGHLSKYKSSIYINWVNDLYTFIAGLFHRNFSVDKDAKQDEVLAGKTLDLNEDTQRMSEPEFFISLFAIGIFMLFRRLSFKRLKNSFPLV